VVAKVLALTTVDILAPSDNGGGGASIPSGVDGGNGSDNGGGTGISSTGTGRYGHQLR